MLNLFKIELLKMKGSKMSIIFLLGGVVSPLLTFLMILGSYRQNPGVSLTFSPLFIMTHLVIVFSIGIIFFGLMTTYLFNREFDEDTMKNLLTIPVERSKLIISKLFTIFVWIEFIMLLSLLIATLLGVIGGFEGLDLKVFLSFVKRYTLTGLLLFLLTPINVFITIYFKNYIPSVAISILANLATLILSQSKYVAYSIWGIPAFLTAEIYASKPHPLSSWIILVGTFLISLIASLIYFNKTDIK